MLRFTLSLGLCFWAFLHSCSSHISEKDNKTIATKAGFSEVTDNPTIDPAIPGKPLVETSTSLKSFNDFWKYYIRHISLFEDFLAFDEADRAINKAEFLTKMKTGLYFPLALDAAQGETHYRLERIPATADKMIAVYMKDFAKQQSVFNQMEGKDFPNFSFVDLDGNQYNNESTKGKVLVIKCWFVSCVPCVAEMPELNHLVQRHKDRNDILFLSLAIDEAEALKGFLSKTKFDYSTVALQKEFMKDQLKVTGYPSHFLVGKNGKLSRVLPDARVLGDFIARELAVN